MKNLIILTGPTAVGKTEISIRLAKAVGAEIISADSMQVYIGMDIGTAKITAEEMCDVKHYLIDILPPKQGFDVVQFQMRAKEAIQKIYENGHIPMIVGGTGFYIQSVLYDIDFNPCKEEPTNEKYRNTLYQIAQNQGNEALHQMLAQVDVASAQMIHPNNVKRVVRALEYYKETGNKISVHNEIQRKKAAPYNFVYFVLNDARERLYAKIDARVDAMFEKGLVEETKRLISEGLKETDIAMQGIGYKEMFDYHKGLLTLQQAKELIKQNTRHFAKRQLTWFKREKEVVWMDYPAYHNDKEQLINAILLKLRERNIINSDE